ncbi:MAG: dTDP-4-dehydrorhamnose 3,5-epimerase [Bdellovibrionales bacterium]|nr:dTDP-4-dehydrorhamnose 3,5-epimerase [Bdellovibrionales bacterium]
MESINGRLKGLVLLRPRVFSDPRGWFMEAYNQIDLARIGVDVPFVQDNVSLSAKGIVRGIHLQRAPHAQGKLVRCLRGAIFDVAVDLRSGSPTFGEWESFELSESNHCALYIPPGFGHAFQALEEATTLYYKCTRGYSKECEDGIRFDDAELGIAWPHPPQGISDKDAALAPFENFHPLGPEDCA